MTRREQAQVQLQPIEQGLMLQLSSASAVSTGRSGSRPLGPLRDRPTPGTPCRRRPGCGGSGHPRRGTRLRGGARLQGRDARVGRGMDGGRVVRQFPAVELEDPLASTTVSRQDVGAPRTPWRETSEDTGSQLLSKRSRKRGTGALQRTVGTVPPWPKMRAGAPCLRKIVPRGEREARATSAPHRGKKERARNMGVEGGGKTCEPHSLSRLRCHGHCS